MPKKIIAAIEAGGTKFICGLADLDGRIMSQTRVETETPEKTFKHVQDYYEQTTQNFGTIIRAGIGTFGPVDLDVNSSTYGNITSTPKPGWSNAPILKSISKITRVPAVIDTDVTCAALAEGIYGRAKGLETYAYITVGTGIGVGVIHKGKSISSVNHLEAGHLRLPRASGDEKFSGICPFHSDCAEGLACGPAMKARWGMEVPDIPDDHEAWNIEAEYIALLCHNITYSVRPQKIIIGGGVLNRDALYPKIRAAFARLTAGYGLSATETDTDNFIVSPGVLHAPSGLVGAVELARQSLHGDLN